MKTIALNTYLKSDIRIFNCLDTSLEPFQLLLSNGTELLPFSFCRDHNYKQNSFLPRPPWRDATLLEREKLLSVFPEQENEKVDSIIENWRTGQDIAVVKMPPEWLGLLATFELSEVRHFSDKKQVFGNPSYKEVLLRFANALMTCTLTLDGFKTYGINIAPSGLPSITNDWIPHSHERHFIGLHIDENDIVPLVKKTEVRNRISINLGKNDRYLMFINLSLIELYKACKGNEPSLDLFYSVEALTEQFLSSYPSFPVVKIRIRPGEAYIAPAQGFIHDGYNPNSEYPDITLNFIGYFRPWRTAVAPH